MRVAIGFLSLLAAVVIVCILAVIVFKRLGQVESTTPANNAGVTSDQVKAEIRDTVGEAYGHKP